eukprot:5314954-Pyramimonas_sp.AAC.1
MLAPLLPLAADPGKCSLPSFHWPLTREYARSPPSIGHRPGIMLAPLLRLAPDPGICSLPSFDWPLTREYARREYALRSSPKQTNIIPPRQK